MRAFIIFLLSSFSALAADTGVSVVSSVTTNEAGVVYATDTFTRGGQTNLVRLTKSLGGIVITRFQWFSHHGTLVAVMSGPPDSPSFTVKAGQPYTVGLDFLPSKDVRCLIISGRDFMDGFYPTNGVYYPCPDSDLEMKDYKR
jgi:hypothetical protein